uniref:Uncharacterized protein n=1 Tax=Strigamia maritima TaxID=126957 RepID=T1JJA5_STRMM
MSDTGMFSLLRIVLIKMDAKLRDTVNMGAQDTPLEDKTFTVVYGHDLVNVSYLNFCCNCREVAKEWTDEVLIMATNLLAINASATTFLEKTYIKMTLQTDKDGKIPVKKLVLLYFSLNRVNVAEGLFYLFPALCFTKLNVGIIMASNLAKKFALCNGSYIIWRCIVVSLMYFLLKLVKAQVLTFKAVSDSDGKSYRNKSHAVHRVYFWIWLPTCEHCRP